MKKNTLFLLTLISFLAFSFAFPDKKSANSYNIDPAISTIVWVGKKVTGEHTGNIKVSKGSLVFDGKNIKSANVEIDMTSISCTDLTDPGYNGKLVGHLKNDVFFGTDKFPKATFVLTKATPKGNNHFDVVGNLTIKNITHEVKFPATIKSEGNKVTATGKVVVDRTKYGIKYGSGSFFDNLGDKAIDNEFTLDLNLGAVK